MYGGDGEGVCMVMMGRVCKDSDGEGVEGQSDWEGV